jgi:DNA-binding MarR family transcriptional regulator
LVPALDEVMQVRTGIPLSWYDVLLELANAPGRRLRMSDLGNRVVLSRSRVSRLVDEMTARGLVEKHSDPDDGRSSFAVLTDSGYATFKAAAPLYVRAIEDQFAAALTSAELAEIARLLDQVLATQAARQA